mgnify:CR=1 FL=1
MKINGEFQGWLRTAILGFAIGVAWGDVVARLKVLDHEVTALRTNFATVATTQANRVPLFDRMIGDFQRMDERVRKLEFERSRGGRDD